MIIDAVDDLPEDLVDDEIRAKAEEFLLEQAGEHDAITLRRLAKRLVEVAAPEQADAAEAARLEREEAAARAAARLTMSDDGHGKTHGRFTIPTHHAAMLRAALLAIAAPKHQHAVNGAGAVGLSAGRVRSGWGRRSVSSSSATRPTGSPTPAASPPPSWSR